MKPENWIKRRNLERTHVASLSNFVVNLVVNILETTVATRGAVLKPCIITECIKLLI